MKININKENDKPLNPVDLTKVIENNSEPSGFIEGKNNEQR